MLKFLGKLFVTITIIAAIAALSYLQFYYRGFHIISQPFTQSETFKSTDGTAIQIVDLSMKRTTWDSTLATLSITVYNNGTGASVIPYDVHATFENKDNAVFLFASDTDTTQWDSGALTTITIPVDTADLGYGQFSLYLRIWDDNKKAMVPIDSRLTCDKNGYFLGSVSILHGIINF